MSNPKPPSPKNRKPMGYARKELLELLKDGPVTHKEVSEKLGKSGLQTCLRAIGCGQVQRIEVENIDYARNIKYARPLCVAYKLISIEPTVYANKQRDMTQTKEARHKRRVEKAISFLSENGYQIIKIDT